MGFRTVGILSPGDMGEGVGASIVGQGIDVITLLAGRSQETMVRAHRAGFKDTKDLAALVSQADLILSIMPPEHAESQASDVVQVLKRSNERVCYADLNAISPQTTRRISEKFKSVNSEFIDGGIIGWAPFKGDKDTRIYVSGPTASKMLVLDGNGKQVIDLGTEIGRASAVKMVYASISKGTDSLLTAAYTAAEALGVRDILEKEWALSQPNALARMERRIPALPADAGRWVGEMEQIAETYDSVGLTDNYHKGAADIYRLLEKTPFSAESRDTIDKERTMQDSVKVFVKYLSAPENG